MTEYAAHRGVSHVAVHKAIKAGRISTINGKIDPKVADIQWAQNTRPRPQRPRADKPHPNSQGVSAPITIDVAPPLGAADDDGVDYWVSRAKREAAEAAIAEMKRAERAGQLIRTEAVRAAWAKRLASTRDALLQIPHRLAPVLAAESDMERVAHLLEDELRHVLDELSRGAEAHGA